VLTVKHKNDAAIAESAAANARKALEVYADLDPISMLALAIKEKGAGAITLTGEFLALVQGLKAK
jgi:hypothetical protein